MENSRRSPADLNTTRILEWESMYINVHALGNLIEGFRSLDISADEETKLEFTRKFDRRLHQEIEKLNLCLMRKSGEISAKIQSVLERTVKLGGRLSDYSISQLVLKGRPTRNLRLVRDYHDELADIGRTLIRLTQFVDQSMGTIDTVIRSASRTFRTHIPVPDSERYDLRNAKEMNVSLLLQALSIPIDLNQGVLVRSRLKTHVLSRCTAKFHISAILKDYHIQTMTTFAASLTKKMDRLSVAEEYIILNASLQKETPRCKSTGYPIAVELLQRISLIGNQKALLNRTLAEQSGAFIRDLIDTTRYEERKIFISDYERRRNLPASNLFLNVLSAFLYIVSIYAPISTAGEYAKSLGGTSSMSGLLIGGASFAGIFSAPVYSKLANDNNFKPSLITASSICLLGNLVYACAATFKSVWLAVAGRCIIGLGGARAINRRYISDCAPIADILKRNAEFVTASAIGMSAGPALAFLVNHFTPSKQVYEPSFLGLYFDRRTNSSWILCLAWIVYIFVLSQYFQEPAPIQSASRISHNESLINNYDSIEGLRDKKKSVSRMFSRIVKVAKELIGVLTILAPEKPVLFCLAVYFIVKMIADMLLASSSSLMEALFNKDKNWADAYIASLGLFMWPVNYLVTRLKSLQVEDRKQLESWQYVMLIGCTSMIAFVAKQWSPMISTHLVIYFITGTVVFVSSNAIEAVVYPSLKRLMPDSLAEGTFNVGLLSTQAGMLGRAAGDFLVAAMSVDNQSGIMFLWKLYVPCILITAVLIYNTYRFWDVLEPDNEIETMIKKGNVRRYPEFPMTSR